MNQLRSKLPISELARLSPYKVIGEWDIAIPTQKISKQLLVSIAETFQACFPWVVYKEMVVAELRDSVSNSWKNDSNIRWAEWLDEYDFQPGELKFEILNIYFNTGNIALQDGSATFSHDYYFGGLTLHSEENELVISLTLYLNFFTKDASPVLENIASGHGEYIDIGADARQHNRKLLSESIACFTRGTNGKVTNSFSENSPAYININGFSEQCEQEIYSAE